MKTRCKAICSFNGRSKQRDSGMRRRGQNRVSAAVRHYQDAAQIGQSDAEVTTKKDLPRRVRQVEWPPPAGQPTEVALCTAAIREQRQNHHRRTAQHRNGPKKLRRPAITMDGYRFWHKLDGASPACLVASQAFSIDDASDVCSAGCNAFAADGCTVAWRRSSTVATARVARAA